MKRLAVLLWLVFYCAAIFLALDFAYGALVRRDGRVQSARVADPIFHHGLAANFDGYENWGELRYTLVTNSLGFKDLTTREVPAVAATRRVLLIGDSFAEGIGMTFEQSFAGLLYLAGQQRKDKVEFLNAGVAGYSPIIYFKKTKFLLDRGVRFDEMVALVDTSDVQDEATSGFCIDDDPQYRKYCDLADLPPKDRCNPSRLPDENECDRPVGNRSYLEQHFPVTNAARVLVKQYVQTLTGRRKAFVLSNYGQSSWSIPGVDMTSQVQPLGVAGGVARAKQNMGLLADLLAQRGIPLTVVVYPWPQQLEHGTADSPQVGLWRDFCTNRCKAFIDLFPAFFAAKAAHADWYERYFILGDVHYSAAGNQLMFDELVKRLL